MPGSASEYVRFANECLDLAERAKPAEKIVLHEMAETWLKLAAAARARKR